MLAPLQDRCLTERWYINWTLTDFIFEESEWITFEYANVEHLPDVPTTIDAGLTRAWDAYAASKYHKQRLAICGQKPRSSRVIVPTIQIACSRERERERKDDRGVARTGIEALIRCKW